VKVKSVADLETFLSSSAGQQLLSQLPDVADEEGEDTGSERDDDMIDLAVGGQAQSGQRHRKLQARGRARIQRAVTLMIKHAGQLDKCLGTDLPTYLELGSIGEQSLRQYVDRMLSLCALTGCSLEELKDEEVDAVLVNFFNSQFFQGKDAWVGEN